MNDCTFKSFEIGGLYKFDGMYTMMFVVIGHKPEFRQYQFITLTSSLYDSKLTYNVGAFHYSSQIAKKSVIIASLSNET